MTVTPEKLLSELPPYNDEWVKVKDKQRVTDIIKLILKQHESFSTDYDRIAPFFDSGNIQTICQNLQSFCVSNLRYVEESEHVQTVGNPASILARCQTGVDCKSYALFIGGCLDAIRRRTGKDINWHYCFASYELTKRTPYHVFVVVDTDGSQLYVDPTPGSADMEPVWIIEKFVSEKKSRVGWLGKKTMERVSGPQNSYGELMPAPSWYPSHLPLFYRVKINSSLPGLSNIVDFRLRPLNAVPSFTETDVLDTCLYLQTLIGLNRLDWQNARSAAWAYRDGSGSAKMWVESAFQKNANGDGGGNFANISPNNQSIDGTFYAKLQIHYVNRNVKTMPWLSSLQAKGGGIDLTTIPAANDREVPRPSWYADYLPGLFYSAGNVTQHPAGFLATKPKIRGGVSSGWHAYAITPKDCAMYMLYAQPQVYAGPTPFPLNWYINDNVNGAMFSWFALTNDFAAGHNNSQMQERMITTSILQQPDLDADPYSSGFSKTLQTIVSAAINFFAGKIPGGAKAVQAAYLAGSIGGGQMITGGPMPAGEFSAAVFKAADELNTEIQTAKRNKQILLFGLFAAVTLGWYYWPDIKKEFK